MTIRGLGVAADKPCYRWGSQLSLLLTLCVPLQNLSGCSCLTSVPAENATVVPGKCPSPGCEEAFLTFLCVMCVCSMIGAMAQTPSVIILIRYGPVTILISQGFSHHPHQVWPQSSSSSGGDLFTILIRYGLSPHSHQSKPQSPSSSGGGLFTILVSQGLSPHPHHIEPLLTRDQGRRDPRAQWGAEGPTQLLASGFCTELTVPDP